VVVHEAGLGVRHRRCTKTVVVVSAVEAGRRTRVVYVAKKDQIRRTKGSGSDRSVRINSCEHSRNHVPATIPCGESNVLELRI
jgi:hypothetical protein